MIYLVAFLAGILVLGPTLAWLTGMFNPIGFLGVPPWKVPESARAADRDNRIWTPQYHEKWLASSACTVTASCEEGDHTYTWPCDLAPSVSDTTQDPA